MDSASVEGLFLGEKAIREKDTRSMPNHLPTWMQIKTGLGGFRQE
jgi:hypothetical protein